MREFELYIDPTFEDIEIRWRGRSAGWLSKTYPVFGVYSKFAPTDARYELGMGIRYLSRRAAYRAARRAIRILAVGGYT